MEWFLPTFIMFFLAHGLSAVRLTSWAWSGDKLLGFLCHSGSKSFSMVLHYPDETDSKVSHGSRQCEVPRNNNKNKKSREEGWMEESPRETWITLWALSKSRENMVLRISQSVSYILGQDSPTPTPPPSSFLFSYPPSIGDSSKGQKSCMDDPLILTSYAFHFTEALRHYNS